MTEIWKDIPGYEGAYQVSDLGRVRSLDRTLVFPTGSRRAYGQLLAVQKHPGGYRQVNMPGGCKLVHRLVALAFRGPCPDGMEVAHGDNDRTNNCLSNLAYATHIENLLHMLVHDTRCYGERNPQAVLTEPQVQDIRRRRRAGHTYKEIAQHFPVTDRTIGKIVRGERWKHA